MQINFFHMAEVGTDAIIKADPPVRNRDLEGISSTISVNRYIAFGLFLSSLMSLGISFLVRIQHVGTMAAFHQSYMALVGLFVPGGLIVFLVMALTPKNQHRSIVLSIGTTILACISGLLYGVSVLIIIQIQ